MIAIQILWYRDGIIDHRVADIFNKIYNSNTLMMDKQEQQRQKEVDILQKICKDAPEDIQLIGKLLELHKSKILMRRKHGLSKELEIRLENFINNQQKQLEQTIQ